MAGWERVAPGVWIGQPYTYRGDADWCAIFQRRDHAQGNRRYYRCGTREKALAFAHDRLRRLATPDAGRILTGTLLARFRSDYCSQLGKRTERLYVGYIENHLTPHLGSVPAVALDADHFFAYGAGKLKGLPEEQAKRRFALVANSLSVMRKALNWYWRAQRRTSQRTGERWLYECPSHEIADVVSRLRRRFNVETQRRRKPYTMEHLSVLVAVAREKKRDALADLLTLAVATGLRLGELLGLEWENIDWLTSTALVAYQIDERGEPALPKSSHSLPVRLPEHAVALLQRRYTERRSDRWVFATKTGKPYRPRNVQRWISEVRGAAEPLGVPLDRTFHSIRHFWASEAIRRGVPLSEVQAQLGHHSAAFTSRQYVHGAAGDGDLSWTEILPVTVVTNRSQRSQDDGDGSVSH